ncbi:YciI family protein [Actinoallomurus acaciae]|uniref:YciI family protein n=1 Tax=Actinoallomurus acaciae TaxID=502577 RepID=A0ABV5YB79_9ACTN
MEYFFYCRDKPGVGDLRWEMAEEHWAFMDGYADRMIARGPTLAADGEEATGSLHIVDLPGADAAVEFAFEEPYYRAGVFDEVLVRRWHNTLGRTMWEFAGGVPGHRRFLIIAHGRPVPISVREASVEQRRRHLAEAYSERLIAHGSLLSEDGAGWMGTASLVELPDRAAAETLMEHDPFARAGLYERVEIHDWRFGGRPAA